MTTRETPSLVPPDQFFLEKDENLLQFGREWLAYGQAAYNEMETILAEHYPLPDYVSPLSVAGENTSEISDALRRYKKYEGQYARTKTIVEDGERRDYFIGYLFEDNKDGFRERIFVSGRGKEKRRMWEQTTVKKEGDNLEEVYEVRDISERIEHNRIMSRNLLTLPDGSQRPIRYSVVEDGEEVSSYWQVFQFDEKKRIVQEVLYGFGEGSGEIFGLDTHMPILQVASITYDDGNSLVQRLVQRMYIGGDHRFADPDNWKDFDSWVKVAKMMPAWETETTDYHNQTRTWGRSTMEQRSQQLQLLGKIVPTVEKMAGISDTAARHYEELNAEMDKLQKKDWEFGDGKWQQNDGIVRRFNINRTTGMMTRVTEGPDLTITLEGPIFQSRINNPRQFIMQPGAVDLDDFEFSCRDEDNNWIHINQKEDAAKVFFVAESLASHMSFTIPLAEKDPQDGLHTNFHKGNEDLLLGDDDAFIDYDNRGGVDTMVRIAKVPLVIQ